MIESSNPELNVSKTKEMVIDFRVKKDKPDIEPIVINGEVVERVHSFKFLGTYISDNLTWSVNCTEILKKARQRLYFLRQLKSFGVQQSILVNFYRAIIESILTSSIIVWFSRVNDKDLRQLCSVR